MSERNGNGMHEVSTSSGSGRMPSLLEEVEAERAADGAARRVSARARAASARSRLIGLGLALLGGVGGVALATIEIGPSPATSRVDAMRGSVENVLGYALLSDDFNTLPLEERLAYLKEFAERFSTMSGSESAAMAAFAAGIEDEIREKFERNVGDLMVDVMDRFATQYAEASEGDAEAAMEEALLGMIELMQEMAGAAGAPIGRERTAEEALARRKEMQERRLERNQDRDTGSIRTEQATRALMWAQGGMGSQGSPSERARISRFMRDANRYMQGRDMKTGEAKRRQ